ncbi:MAG: 4-hydroxythreonine-4-phosphate dehydrogenase PdxA [Nitrospiraceae bacterium]|nr:4-hydroxythreonine-4-phosphate dehydrogenase PdxA [Nitrospiraceae bacterium]
MTKLPKLAITIGEPGGIGPEVAVRAAASPEVRSVCAPILIGGELPIRKALDMLSLPFELREINGPRESRPDAGVIEFVPAGHLPARFKRGAPTAGGGAACYEYIKKAAGFAVDGDVHAVCTAPISKKALRMAGVAYPGHTEMLAELTGARRFAMMLVGGPLRVLLVTIHAAIRDVPDMIKKDVVLEKILLASVAARMLGIAGPRIGVCGLNPHAGEEGLFGEEEIREIAPAVRQARRRGIDASGPVSPDVLFRKAFTGETDIVLAMYHDQGLIPLKMIAFDRGVNVTVGLPIIRTSPDHGTAYDIAWKGRANPASMIEAVRTAVSLRP